MRWIAAILLGALATIPASAELGVFTNGAVYTDGQPLFVYGTAIPGESLVARIFAPDGTITRFDQIDTDTDEGTFNHLLLVWPTPTTDIPYGTYTVEVISTRQGGLTRTIDVHFAQSDELVEVPVSRSVTTTVFAPDTAATGSPVRIFAQTASDGQLIVGEPAKLLRTSHVHLPDGSAYTLTDSFRTLHKGLYYTDYTPHQLGTHVFHVVTFHRGTVSHGSAATNVLAQDLGGISEQIVKLDAILDETSADLDRLNARVTEFGAELESASSGIDQSVGSVSESVSDIVEASGQLNSLLFPVVALIAVIVAIQIAILARRR